MPAAREESRRAHGALAASWRLEICRENAESRFRILTKFSHGRAGVML